jgi:arabinogalactan oligomer / maltooligosaccharide transport system permease protein
MATATVTPGSKIEPEVTRQPEGTLSRVLKFIGLLVLNMFALLLIYTFVYDANPGFALIIALITIFADVVYFVPSLYPIRWIAPGLMLVILLVVYPLIFTVSTAFSNYSDGNLFAKEQAVRLIENQDRSYVSPDALVYNWDVYQAADGTYALWLTRETDDGGTEVVFAPAEQAITPVESPPEEAPSEYNGYSLLDRAGRTRALSALQNTTFGTGEDTAGITGRNTAARPTTPRYDYDPAADTITDRETGTVYVANDEIGFFVPQGARGDLESQSLNPGYRVNVGFANFTRLANDPALRGPLIDIFVWTFVFAILSVLTTFAVGLGMALVLNDPIIPARKVFRSLLLIPYAIPGVIGIVVWRGMLNQNLGIVNDILGDVGLIQQNVPWLLDPLWAKVAILLVNLWLGYPYMMLICSGALQSIPSEVYEAASVDGATPWQKFWGITLPLLLVAVGPLLIGSFTFNFNNYLLITALTGGNPPILNSPIPGAGQTDILISYVYKSAFSNQADYGYASAITIIIFLIVASVTLLQFRFTKTWEQVGENV